MIIQIRATEYLGKNKKVGVELNLGDPTKREWSMALKTIEKEMEKFNEK
jgi:hypothetical protein